MGGFYKPTAGAIRLGDRNVAGLPSHAVARAGIARTYQTTQLFGQMSVLDNLLIALRRGRLESVVAAFGRAGRDESLRATAESLLTFVGYQGSIHVPTSA